MDICSVTKNSPAILPKEVEKKKDTRIDEIAQANLTLQQIIAYKCSPISSTHLKWIKEMCQNYTGNPNTLCLIDLIGLDITKKWDELKNDIEALICQFENLMVEIKFRKNRNCPRGQINFFYQLEEGEVAEDLKEALNLIESQYINQFYNIHLYAYISFSAINSFPLELQKYIDNKHIISNSSLQEGMLTNFNKTKMAVKTILRTFSELERHLNDLKNPNKEEEFKKSFTSVKRKSIILDILFSNIVCFWKRKDAKILLSDVNIAAAAPEFSNLLLPQNKDEAKKGLKELLNYADCLFGKKMKYSNDPLFENLFNEFPDQLSYSKMIAFTVSVQKYLSYEDEETECLKQLIPLVLSGEIDHEKFCKKCKIEILFPKEQEEFISYFFFLYFKQGTKRLLLNDIYSLVQQSIDFINPRHTYLRKRSAEQLMVNFEELKKLIDVDTIGIKMSSENSLTSFQEEVKIDLTLLVKKMMGEFHEDFINKLSVIASTFGEVYEGDNCLNSSTLKASMPKSLENNVDMDEHKPIAFRDSIMWVLIPLFNQNENALRAFYSHIEILKELQQKYFFRLKEIKEKDTFTQAKKIIEDESHYLMRFVFFIKDIEALLGRFTEEELEQETYLLPEELIQFLDLEDFQESVVTPISCEDEIDETLQKDVSVIIDEKVKKTCKLPSNTDQKNSLSKELAPKRGEKLRKYFKRLKRIKVALGLIRVTGSHHHFGSPEKGGIVTVPIHGGGNSLKVSTARSVGKQMAKILQGQK